MKQITVIGNLGKDSEISTKGNLNFTLGVSDDVDKTKTDWFNCYMENTSLQQYLKKGKKILITGRLYFSKTANGEHKNNIQVKDFSFVDTIKKQNNQEPETSNTSDGRLHF